MAEKVHACRLPHKWRATGSRWSCRRCGAAWVLDLGWDSYVGYTLEWERDQDPPAPAPGPRRRGFAWWCLAFAVLALAGKVVLGTMALHDGLSLTAFLLVIAPAVRSVSRWVSA